MSIRFLMLSECTGNKCAFFSKCRGFCDCPGRRYAYWSDKPQNNPAHDTQLSEHMCRCIAAGIANIPLENPANNWPFPGFDGLKKHSLPENFARSIKKAVAVADNNDM